MKVLVVDDDRDLVAILTFALGRQGLTVVPAHDIQGALTALEAEQPDAAIVDVYLGRGVPDGFEVLRRLRERSPIPVLMLTGQNDEADVVRGLELGANDYLVKPFSYRILLARLQAALRQYRVSWPATAAGGAAPPTESVLRAGPLVLDVREQQVTQAGRLLVLTRTEFRLLRCLMDHAGDVVPTGTLLQEVLGWGDDTPSNRAAIRVAVHRLRRKLDDGTPAAQHRVRTVPRAGVQLLTGDEPPASPTLPGDAPSAPPDRSQERAG